MPNHVASEIITMVGDVTSLAHVQQTCLMTQAMILDPMTWSERNPGVICGRAIEGDWFHGGSHLALALRASRFMSLQWPLTHRTMLIAETTMVLWRSKGTVLAPLLFDLDAGDLPERCLFTVGTATNSERCWCELNNLQGASIMSSMSHSRSREAARTRIYDMPRSPMQGTRRFQVQWWQDTLQVCMDGYYLGSLPLEPNQIPHKAQIAIYVFRSGYGGLSTNQCRSCVLPTELGTSWVYEHLAEQRGPPARQDDLHAGGLDVSSLMLLQCSFLESLRDFMALGSCNSTLWQSMQHSQFWHEVDLHLTQHLSVAFRRTRLFENLLRAWAGGIRSVSCPHYFLHYLSVLDKKLMLHGSGEYLPNISGDILGPAKIVYWRSQRQTCGAVTLECSLPTGASFLLLALRRAEYESNPDNSTCLIIHRPIEATRTIRFRFSDGGRMVVPTPTCVSLTQTHTHTYQLRWQRGCLEFLFDNQLAATVPLTPRQDLEPWARAAAMCVAHPDCTTTDFQVHALPFQYSASVRRTSLRYLSNCFS